MLGVIQGTEFLLVLLCRIGACLFIKAPSTRIRIFSNPQLFRSGYGYRPHVSEEFDSESGKNKSALPTSFPGSLCLSQGRQRRETLGTRLPLSKVEKNISATSAITCGRVNPDIFLIR